VPISFATSLFSVDRF